LGLLDTRSTWKVISQPAFVFHQKGKYHHKEKLAICGLDHSTVVLALMNGVGACHLFGRFFEQIQWAVGYPHRFGEMHESRNR
jgi:hypothetical protein